MPEVLMTFHNALFPAKTFTIQAACGTCVVTWDTKETTLVKFLSVVSVSKDFLNALDKQLHQNWELLWPHPTQPACDGLASSSLSLSPPSPASFPVALELPVPNLFLKTAEVPAALPEHQVSLQALALEIRKKSKRPEAHCYKTQLRIQTHWVLRPGPGHRQPPPCLRTLGLAPIQGVQWCLFL